MNTPVSGFSSWVTIVSLPTRSATVSASHTAPLDQPSNFCEDELRGRLDELIGSLEPGEYLMAQVAASAGGVILGLGLWSSTSLHTQQRLGNALDGFADAVPGIAERPCAEEFRIQPTSTSAPAAAARTWPITGIDVDALLAATRQLNGAMTLDIVITASSEPVSPVSLQRRLARIEERLGESPLLTHLRESVSAGQRQFDISMQLSLSSIVDVNLISNAMFPGMGIVAEPQLSSEYEFSAIDKLLRGASVVQSQAAALLPLASLPAESLAPIERRAPLVGSTRARTTGQLTLGTGRGGTPVGISPIDLYQHVAVYGKTGFGKTTATTTLLRGIKNTIGTPFLIIDPLKEDYELLLGELGEPGTPGYWEIGAPGSPPVNLLAPPAGVDALDYAGLFAGAFAQATRLDEFPLAVATLRDCLDRTINRWRVEGRRGSPPLSALYNDVQRYARSADARSRGAVETAVSIKARLRALVTGTAGNCLLGGPEAGVDWHDLTERPMLISLRHFVDPESRNAVFALLLAAFVAYRNHNPAPSGHIMVIEEAHSLFPNRTDESGGLIGQQLSAAIASLRGRKQGFALVTQSPQQIPLGIRSLVGTRLAFRVDDDAAAWLAPNQPDIAHALTGLRRGEVALWAASGDPRVTFFHTAPPSGVNIGRPPLPFTAPAVARSVFTEVALDTARDDEIAEKIGTYIAGHLAKSAGDDLEGLITQAEALTIKAMDMNLPVSSPVADVARAILTAALLASAGNDVALASYLAERAASSRAVANLATRRS